MEDQPSSQEPATTPSLDFVYPRQSHPSNTCMPKAFLLGVCLCLCAVWTRGEFNENNPKYSNLWVAKIEGGEGVAHRIARDLGYTYKGQLGHFENYYKLTKEDHPEVSLRDSDHLTRSLLDLDEVKWASQEMLVRLVTYQLSTSEYSNEIRIMWMISFLKEQAQKISKNKKLQCKSIFSCIKDYPSDIFSSPSIRSQGDLSKLGTIPTTPVTGELLKSSRSTTASIGLVSEKVSAYILEYSDPFWRKQWNMQDYRTKDMPVMDLNVVPVHRMGYTGKGVIVGVVDTGVDYYNPDLNENVVRRLSYDICNDKPGCLPAGNLHGTKCAGVIAMKPNNNLCGVGIAYDTKIVGIRAICDYDQTQLVTARALMHGNKKIDIYSNSWGYQGRGVNILRKDHLSEEAYYTGVTKGRNGKGVIFVRSAGNDKDYGDNCAVDPNNNSPYAITIAGADQFGKLTYYSERCTSVMATTYTQGKLSTEGIVAPNIGTGCVTDLCGTSAACPQASGIIALVLEANRELTYRDVMHLITMSAEVAPLADNEDIWYKNGRGFWVSNDFGFGLMNAENMVILAKNWENVPPMRECIISVEKDEPTYFDYMHDAEIEFHTSACSGTSDEVNFIEHIELASVVQYPYRGGIVIAIKSPAGTSSLLLEPRLRDSYPNGLDGLGIVSTHNWGESPQGTWTVTYKTSAHAHRNYPGWVHDFTLKLYGTKLSPSHYKMTKAVRKYAAFRLPDGQTS